MNRSSKLLAVTLALVAGLAAFGVRRAWAAQEQDGAGQAPAPAPSLHDREPGAQSSAAQGSGAQNSGAQNPGTQNPGGKIVENVSVVVVPVTVKDSAGE